MKISSQVQVEQQNENEIRRGTNGVRFIATIPQIFKTNFHYE